MPPPDVQALLRAYARLTSACAVAEVLPQGADRPLSAHQARILRHLDATDPTMVTELAEYMGVTASTMSLNLKRLEEAGYITRERDPEDRRVMNIRLTPEGALVVDSIPVLDPSRVDRLLASLGFQDRRRALEGLSLLAEAADLLAPVGSQPTPLHPRAGTR